MRNVPDELQRWINKQIRKVPELPQVKILGPERQSTFNLLCTLYNNSVEEYKNELKKLKRWSSY